MPQFRYKFVRVNPGGKSVILRKIPDGGLGEFMNMFGKGGTEFDANKRECLDLLKDAQEYQGTKYPGAQNSENNIDELRQALNSMNYDA